MVLLKLVYFTKECEGLHRKHTKTHKKHKLLLIVFHICSVSQWHQLYQVMSSYRGTTMFHHIYKEEISCALKLETSQNVVKEKTNKLKSIKYRVNTLFHQ